MNHTNSTWGSDELQKIVAADDLKISPFREDGATYGTPTWIWNVAVNGDLYVRAYNGRKSRWYSAALTQKAGRIYTAGRAIEVSFECVEGRMDNIINDAYRAKYKNSAYLGSMISERAILATVKIIPR